MRSFTRRGMLKSSAAGLSGAALLAASGRPARGRAQNGEPVTVTLWHYYAGSTTAPFEALLQRYMDETPGVTIEPRLIPFPDFNRTLLQGAAAGDLPDIALVNAFDTQLFAEAGLTIDLTDRVEEWGGAGEFFPTCLETSLWNGRNYGLPHLADCYVLWYSDDIFAEAGLEPPATWEELGTTAAELSGDNRYGIAVDLSEGVSGATAVVIRMLAAGADITNVDSEGGREAVQQWVDLIEAGSLSRGALGWIEDDVAAQFATGQAAMMINSATYVNFFRTEYPDFAWSLALLPEDETRQTFLSSENLTITSGSEQVDAAWDLMTWMQLPEVLNEYLPERNKLPARRDVASDPQWADDPVWSVFVSQLDSAWAPAPEIAQYSAEILTYIQAAAQAAISGDSSVEEALAAAQAEIDGVIPEE